MQGNLSLIVKCTVGGITPGGERDSESSPRAKESSVWGHLAKGTALRPGDVPRGTRRISTHRRAGVAVVAFMLRARNCLIFQFQM